MVLRRLIVFLCLLHAYCFAIAQPIINTAWFPKQGDVLYTAYYKDKYYSQLKKENTGSNYIWDFRDMELVSPVFKSDTFKSVSNNMVTCGSMTTNIYNGKYPYRCYYVDSSGLYVTGDYWISWHPI